MALIHRITKCQVVYEHNKETKLYKNKQIKKFKRNQTWMNLISGLTQKTAAFWEIFDVGYGIDKQQLRTATRVACIWMLKGLIFKHLLVTGILNNRDEHFFEYTYLCCTGVQKLLNQRVIISLRLNHCKHQFNGSQRVKLKTSIPLMLLPWNLQGRSSWFKNSNYS